LVSKIELLLRSRLVKDALSSMLIAAGFSVFHEPGQGDDAHTIVIIDLEDCKDPENVRAHRQCAVKIVAFAHEADSREMRLDEIAPLSGILTYGLSADAFVQSLRLICAGERLFPRDLGLGRRPQAHHPAPSHGLTSTASRPASERYFITWLKANRTRGSHGIWASPNPR
jgi:hypothetical protein